MTLNNKIVLLFFLLAGTVNAVVKKWDPVLYNLILGLDDEHFIKQLQLPDLFGCAISEYQVSGAFHLPTSQWALWEQKSFHNGKPTISSHDRSENGVDFWDAYHDDVGLMDQELGINTFRFSIDWSAIEPAEGFFDQTALDHYAALIQDLTSHNIEPMITLHHFSHPGWFEAKGGFAKRRNIKYFVRFCKKVFGEFSDCIRLWCTINEIGPFVFQGYINGVFPPGKSSLSEGFYVMANMLEAHAIVYRVLKAMPNGKESEIGLVHQYLSFEGYSQSWIGICNPLEQLPITFMNYLFNDAMLYALRYDVVFPWMPRLRRTIKGLSESYDFIGLNFYSRVVIRSRVVDTLGAYIFSDHYNYDLVGPTNRPGELMTDMQYALCPESFYDAIMEINKLNVPIYITENGCPDCADDKREIYIKTYLFALSEAIKAGANVKGYYYWSLMDNFEWNEGWSKKFGLYEVDLVTKKRSLRNGARIFQKISQYKKTTT